MLPPNEGDGALTAGGRDGCEGAGAGAGALTRGAATGGGEKLGVLPCGAGLLLGAGACCGAGWKLIVPGPLKTGAGADGLGA